MPHVRRDVWRLPAGDTTLEWYGKAVEALQKRPIEDITSWWSLGAMHGIDEKVWQGFGFIEPSTPLPLPNLKTILWKQCQHLTWYFLPWHRGYLAAFETIVRDAIKKLGGPGDWALPYWNYSDDPNARELPRAFAKPTLSGGGKNFLHVPQRYGSAQIPKVQSPIVLDGRVVAVDKTLRERLFEGSADGGSAGFGGIKTPFWHGDESNDGTFGVLETQPHGGVHVWVGGGFKGSGLSKNPLEWGLMTNPDTAALDPIFWLHHSNIDRLWNVWLRQKPQPGDPPDAFKNPTDPDWLDGPRNRAFAMPRPDGTTYGFTARDMLDTRAPALDYIYDDDAAPAAPSDHLALRLETLGASPTLAAQVAGAVTMAPKPAELLGANSNAVRLNGDVVETRVRLDSGQRQKLSATLEARTFSATAARAPDRVYLNLENIKSPSDAAVFYVYVNLPQGADPEKHPDHLAGTLSMFGVSKASASQGSTGGNGVTMSFDVTSIIDKMHAENSLGSDLSVKLVSAVPGATSDDISIGRISVYRQGQ
jgi:tyrosinase